MSPRDARGTRGRPRAAGLGEDIAALCVLAREGSTTSATDLAALLDIGERRAQETLRTISTETVVSSGADDVLGPIVPLCNVGENGRVTRIDAPSHVRMRQLRLTPTQADAASTALDRLGIAPSAEVRKSLEAAFFPKLIQEDQGVRKDAASRDAAATGAPHAPSASHTLETCARAIVRGTRTCTDAHNVRGPVLSFGYRGANDPMTRTRRVVALRLRVHEGEVMLDAYDLDARGGRTFRVGQMEHPALGEARHTVPVCSEGKTSERVVRVSCRGSATDKVLGLEGVHILSRGKGTTVVEVPYFRGDWLPRRLLSLGDLVTIDDEGLLREMRAIAREDLDRARTIRDALAAGQRKTNALAAGRQETSTQPAGRQETPTRR
ncbi:WYL domain-containing protein [uncultured Parolsenella sp.]|uniref:helix-turn-helix transcriptional regulator n=1 Tax=uncultured Parolsenella sp. TaxID=2083008 RepID=UPI0027DE4AEF|nr:WYL domain-containing protein [uncultured Parolsenella sp.]